MCAFLSFIAAFFGPAFMGEKNYIYNPADAAAYAAFAPILWCFCFSWIIFTSQLGHAGNHYFLLILNQSIEFEQTLTIIFKLRYLIQSIIIFMYIVNHMLLSVILSLSP